MVTQGSQDLYLESEGGIKTAPQKQKGIGRQVGQGQHGLDTMA